MEQNPKRITRRRISSEKRERLTKKAVELYEKELISTREIGERLGFAPTTIRQWLIEAGVKRRPRDGGKGRTKLPLEVIERMRFLMEHTDFRDKEIIAALGLEINELGWYRKKFNLPEVSLSEQARRGAETRYGKRKAPNLDKVTGKAVNQHGLR